MSTPILILFGTWGRAQQWYKPNSPLWTALEARGFSPIVCPWSGFLGGYHHPIIVPPASDIRGTLELWRSEAEKAALFCKTIGLERPHVISHSHAINLVAFAAAGTDFTPPQPFATVLSISGPIRQDMAFTRAQAKLNIQKWIQVTDPKDDHTIRQGEFLDGHIGWNYHLPEADVNIDAPGWGHSRLTVEIEPAWTDLGLWRELVPETPAPPAVVHFDPPYLDRA
jgi:hypothetical protein